MSISVKGYSLQESQYIKEIDSEAKIYIHEGTKAKILVMSNDDIHKSFCVGFRTPTDDSTGVPHIIEHSVLCGSEKYPLKAPFVELAKGSLNTFLNAMTFPDKTLYPIASQNDKDFQNLMDVYLNAVFFPKIHQNKEILMQEGWRYHLESKDDELVYKGVVYNEMKGAFSSPEQVQFSAIQQALFPDTAYANESGGAPENIPDLTYEDFVGFHKRYYHPSNSYICLYGNMDVEKTLAYIDKDYLSKFEYQEIDSKIDTQKAFDSPVTKKAYYSGTPGKEDELLLSYNFIVGNLEDRKLELAMTLLKYVLLDAQGSILKKALIKEGIGEEVYGEFETDLKQPIFAICAKNVKESKKERFYQIVDEVLNDIVKNGIPKKLLNAAFQVKEFSLRESEAGRFPKGLIYSMTAIKTWIYDLSPLKSLKYDEEIKELRDAINTNYYEGLIKEFFIDNNHCAKVEVYPKIGLEKETEDKEIEKLSNYKKSLSEDELDALVKQTLEFNNFQTQIDDEEVKKCMPLLERSDLTKETKYPRYEVKTIDKIEYIITPVFTNKISYINWNINLHDLPEEYIPYMGMIVGMLGKLDTENYKYEDLNTYIDEHIGGVKCSIQSLNGKDYNDEYMPLFKIQSKALTDQISHQVGIMREILMNTKFEDSSRILEIIKEMKSMIQGTISYQGHMVTFNRIFANLTKAGNFDEKTNGIYFYEFMSKIEKEWSTTKDDVIGMLKKAYEYLANKSNIKVGLVADEKEVEELTVQIQKEIAKIPKLETTKVNSKFEITEIKEALIYPSNINYVSMAYNFKELGFEYHGGMVMLKTVLSMGYLWNKVRVQNGAYGCFSIFNRNGNMAFASYRDPNITKTLDCYRSIASYIETIELTDRELLQYLIGSISEIDFPYTPSSEGEAAQVYYMTNVTKEDLQKSRDELFATNNEELRKFAEIIKACTDKEYYCVFGNEQNIENSKVEFTKKTII